ncbi:MAG: PQQ-dependent sugar dehydrogenase, partial [Planctomycetaceae bacterium]
MGRRSRFLTGVVAVAACLAVVSQTASAAKPRKPLIRKHSGIEKRVLWTSRVVGTPDPPAPYQTEVAFPRLRFSSPLAMNVVPGTNRLVVAERYGKIFTFPNRRNVKRPTLLIDLKKTVYGVALHPDYAKNGQVFVTYVLDPGKPSARGTRVSRFTVKDPGTSIADPKSERILLEWPSGGHNGGCLRFGPDGYLYVSAGDSSGIADEVVTGQDISDIPGSILRIDVDRSEGKRGYAIPKDNPFVNRKGARPEIFSYGHRQLWKFSFDTKTGRMWGGEIGQDLWEMIYILKKGGNYGWSVMEGSHPFRPQRPKGPTPFVKPIVEHSHNEFRSITGGYIYHADRLPGLKGAYIYGDYDTGRIWAFKYAGGKVREHRELMDTTLRPVAFGTDTAGEVYIVDFVGGALHRLVKSPPPQSDRPRFPRKLSETGLFASTKDHTPAPGVIPYSVNAPLYSDNAIKDRFIAIPGKGRIEFDAVVYPQPAPGAPPGWRFPDGTVLVKTFSLELEP